MNETLEFGTEDDSRIWIYMSLAFNLMLNKRGMLERKVEQLKKEAIERHTGVEEYAAALASLAKLQANMTSLTALMNAY